MGFMATIRHTVGGARIVGVPGEPGGGMAGGGGIAGGDGPAGGGGGGPGPPCAICARAGSVARRLVHLTHGVSVWLCHTHGGDAFMGEEQGVVFAERLAAMWIATGGLTCRREAALLAYVRMRRTGGSGRDLPGSYSWPLLRREAEARFAAGDDPRVVIVELRARYVDCPASTPSVRTMRRWYTQARWIARRSPGRARARRRRRVAPGFELIPYALTRHLRWDYVHAACRDG